MFISVFVLSACVLIGAWSPPNTQLKSLKGYRPDPHLTFRDNILRFMSDLKWDVSGLRRQNTKRSYNHWLRQLANASSSNTEPPKTEPTEVKAAEGELRSTLSNRMSALERKPYVEKKGPNDFLVIGDPNDATANVIPNDIYYNIEKGCVNWLDNCNQKGIKSNLINRIIGPYGK